MTDCQWPAAQRGGMCQRKRMRADGIACLPVAADQQKSRPVTHHGTEPNPHLAWHALEVCQRSSCMGQYLWRREVPAKGIRSLARWPAATVAGPALVSRDRLTEANQPPRAGEPSCRPPPFAWPVFSSAWCGGPSPQYGPEYRISNSNRDSQADEPESGTGSAIWNSSRRSRRPPSRTSGPEHQGQWSLRWPVGLAPRRLFPRRA